MPTDCLENTTLVLKTDVCKGKKISTLCVINESAFSLLETPVNTTLDVILNKLVQALNSAKTINDQQQITIDNLLERVALLET